jgi:hypothetical protein
MKLLIAFTTLLVSLAAFAADNDGDLLLDSWEAAYGISTNLADSSGLGIGDYFDDPDHDGLPNHAELAAGTNPTNAYTSGGTTLDYYTATNTSTIGATFTDNDHLEDWWEARHSPAASMHVWDETTDADADGWDVWSERQAGTDPGDSSTFPTPVLSVRLRYYGAQSAASMTLVIHAYTDPYMNGVPNAVYTRTLSAPYVWPMVLDLTADDLALGHLRQGLNYFYAFLDLDNSRNPAFDDATVNWLTWTPGEPAGIADGHEKGIDIGWDRNEIRIGLTDEAKSFARLSWADRPGFDAPQNTIGIYAAHGGALVFERVIKAPRTWLHEGDIIAGKTENFGLTSDGPGTKVYRWKLNGYDQGFITNTYPVTMPTPILVDPKNDVIAARPVFQFRLASEATEFEIEIRRNTATGPVLYTGRHLAPARTRFSPWAVDLCTWQFPHHAGNVLPSGQVFGNGTYYWKVRGFSPVALDGSTWTPQTTFRLAVNATPQVTVKPVGQSRGNGTNIVAGLWPNPAFSGPPIARATIPYSASTTTLIGMPPGLYYLAAYVDTNASYSRDASEQWGYHRLPNDAVRPFAPAVVLIRPNTSNTVPVYMMGPR